MNGIRVYWTQTQQEEFEAFLTFDQVRERFGLGGTPDGLVRQRLGQVASRPQIRDAAKELGNPRMLTWTAQEIQRLNFTTSELPETDTADWPPQAGDIWEAEGMEYYGQDWNGLVLQPTVATENNYAYGVNKSYVRSLDDFKSLRPRLVRRRP